MNETIEYEVRVRLFDDSGMVMIVEKYRSPLALVHDVAWLGWESPEDTNVDVLVEPVLARQFDRLPHSESSRVLYSHDTGMYRAFLNGVAHLDMTLEGLMLLLREALS